MLILIVGQNLHAGNQPAEMMKAVAEPEKCILFIERGDEGTGGEIP